MDASIFEFFQDCDREYMGAARWPAFGLVVGVVLVCLGLFLVSVIVVFAEVF